MGSLNDRRSSFNMGPRHFIADGRRGWPVHADVEALSYLDFATARGRKSVHKSTGVV
jgi:hypothetical protein